jgi:hypothetical protein
LALPAGQKIETDTTRMVDGLVELLDDLSDLAINRLVLHSRLLPGGFNPGILGQAAIDRFKIAWFSALGELMFVGLAGEPKIDEFRDKFLAELRYAANERGVSDFLDEILRRVKAAIDSDREFCGDGIFARPVASENPDGARAAGLGPTLAAMIGAASFDDVTGVEQIRDRLDATLESEFVNAYGHCAMACARFTMV